MQSKPFFERPDAVLYMGGITALTAISIDLVLPATGLIAREFGEAEEKGALLIGVYFLAYAVGQFFWGLFSDAYGRRLSLILALIGFTLASFACTLAPDFQTLLILRAVQGLMGGTPIIARAMVRDISRGQKAARLMSVLMAILTISTMIAPVLGAAFLIAFDWRALFICLGIAGLLFLAYTLLVLPEVGQKRPERMRLSFIKHTATGLYGQRAFVVPMLIGTFCFAGYSAILSTSAIVTETVYGITPQMFGLLFAVTAGFNTVGALLINRYLKHHSVAQALRLAVTSVAVTGLLQLVMLVITPSLLVFWLSICLFVLTFGMCLPTSVAAALEPAEETPGFAASLIGGTQMLIGASGAFIASAFFDGSHRAIPLTMILFITLLVGIYILFPLAKTRDA